MFVGFSIFLVGDIQGMRSWILGVRSRGRKALHGAILFITKCRDGFGSWGDWVCVEVGCGCGRCGGIGVEWVGLWERLCGDPLGLSVGEKKRAGSWWRELGCIGWYGCWFKEWEGASGVGEDKWV